MKISRGLPSERGNVTSYLFGKPPNPRRWTSWKRRQTSPLSHTPLSWGTYPAVAGYLQRANVVTEKGKKWRVTSDKWRGGEWRKRGNVARENRRVKGGMIEFSFMYLVYITKFIIFAVRRMRIKYKKILAKYKYINCPSLDVTKYNTKTKEGMMQLVDDYTKTCK